MQLISRDQGVGRPAPGNADVAAKTRMEAGPRGSGQGSVPRKVRSWRARGRDQRSVGNRAGREGRAGLTFQGEGGAALDRRQLVRVLNSGGVFPDPGGVVSWWGRGRGSDLCSPARDSGQEEAISVNLPSPATSQPG